MRGCRHGRRHPRASLPEGAAAAGHRTLLAAAPAAREAAVAEGPSNRTCDASGSTSSPSLESRVWENLLESMLHQIIALISSFHDFLAFSGTCRSWRTASSSFRLYIPSPSHLSTSNQILAMAFSTLILNGGFSILPRELYPFAVLRPELLHVACRMRYLGCSYGYFIFSDREHCHLVDVYTGTKVKSPKFQFNGDSLIYYGILVAPLSSPNSQLILFSRTSMLQW